MQFRPRAVDPDPTVRELPPTVTSRLWYRALLTSGPIGVRHVPMIREHFAEVLEASEWPEGACLFLCTSRALFFSPAAIAAVPHLIVACGAEPSLPPDRTGATLLVGKTSDWNLLPYERH
jgi:hypothetical protein